MEFFDPKKLNFNFVKYFRLGVWLSLTLSLVSLILIWKPGLNYGIDFKGGVDAQVDFKDKNINQKDLRALLEGKLKNVQIVNYAETGKSAFSVTTEDSKDFAQKTIKEVLEPVHGPEGQSWNIAKIDSVGPKIGAELRKSAILSLIYTCILVTLYMYWRFDIRYSPGALACIFHDLTLTAGFLVVTRAEFSTTVVAALLTLAGYSINDTVVVFDRIRELEKKYPGRDKSFILNLAINTTLSRTIMTSMLTLGACVVLYFLAGPTLRDFSMALFFGIVVGTYSSAFVAAPLYLWSDNFFNRQVAKKTAVGKPGGARA